jgi:hypothetical protein
VLHDRRCGLQAAIGANRQDRDASASIVGDQHVAADLVYDQVCRTVSARRLLVQWLEHPGRAVHGECSHRACILALETADLVGGVDKRGIGMHGKVAWARRFRRELRRRQCTGREIESRHIDAAALFAGIRTEKDECFAGRLAILA